MSYSVFSIPECAKFFSSYEQYSNTRFLYTLSVSQIERRRRSGKIKARSFKIDDDIFVGENCYLPKAPSVHSSRTYRYHVMLLGPLLNSEINLARTLADPVK